MTGRDQIVKYKEECLDAVETKFGVENTEIRLFADDTVIYITANTISEVDKKILIAVDRMEDWFNKNSLKIKVGKVKSMLIRGIRKVIPRGMKVKTRYGSRIEMVQKIKYLGGDDG